MRLFPHKRLVSGQDLQPSDYLNPDIQDCFTVGNAGLDSKNLNEKTLRSTDFAFQAWQEVQQVIFTSLSSINVVDTSTDYDSFGALQNFTVNGSGMLYGSVTLPYNHFSVGEVQWWSGTTYLTAGYNSNEFKFILHHKFAVLIDGIIVAETDNIGQGTGSGLHLNFFTPIQAGQHSIEIKVKLANGSALASAVQFAPGAYGYGLLHLRKR
jgi:hypothetical protein